jgi:nucleoside 2-deoxyribosyltransferase
MKVYVAGPMSGLPDFNYPAFRAAGAVLVEAGFEVLNPIDTTGGQPPAPEHARPWDWYMRQALKMVADADGVALLPGWERSRGARLEQRVALGLGIEALRLETWISR